MAINRSDPSSPLTDVTVTTTLHGVRWYKWCDGAKCVDNKLVIYHIWVCHGTNRHIPPTPFSRDTFAGSDSFKKKKKKNYQPWTCTETQSQQETSPSVSSLSRWVLWQLLFWSNLRRSERSVCVCVRVRGVPSACVWQRRHHLQQWVWAACTSLQRTDGPAGGQPRRVQ